MRSLIIALVVTLFAAVSAPVTAGAQEKRYKLPLTTEEWMWIIASRKAFQKKHGYYPRRGRSLSNSELVAVLASRSKDSVGAMDDVGIPEQPLPEDPDVIAVPGICLTTADVKPLPPPPGTNPPPTQPPVEPPPTKPPVDPCDSCDVVTPVEPQ